MAEEKRYYWIKLKDKFITSDAVDYLMSQKNGANYVVLYQMLCLKTINTQGTLARHIGEILIPYDAEKIQRDCKYFDIDTVRVAIELYKKLGLVYEQSNGILQIANFENLVGGESESAERVRAHRLREGGKRALLCNGNVTTSNETCNEQCNEIVTIDKDIRYKRKIIDEDKVLQPDATSSTEPNEPVFITLSLISNEEYPITFSKLDELKPLYPAINIEQCLRDMKGWLIGNPKNRKTKSGIMRFITGWLSREQNKAKPINSGKCSNPFLDDLKAMGGLD